MATVSIEALGVGVSRFYIRPTTPPLCTDFSFPPISDRAPSLWQVHMSSVGGGLLHFFDCSSPLPRRWAYEILEEDEWTVFSFRKSIAAEIFSILKDLVLLSPAGEVWLYSDAQWSNAPSIHDEPHRLCDLEKLNQGRRLRFNAAYRIVRD